MLTLAYPWMLLLLPLPILWHKLTAAHREQQNAVRIPSLERMTQLTGGTPSSGAVILTRSRRQLMVLLACWLAVVIAVARPQWIGTPVTKTIPSRDLLLAVDLSASMDTKDFTDADGNRVDRLTAVKQVLDDFLTRRQGDRIGLIFFGSAAFVQAPFTEDLELCRQLLDEAQTRMAGPKTVIGDAIGLAITVFERSDQQDQTLILLTDGNDTGSKVPPDRAATVAKDKGITIYTIAVGDPEAVGEEQIDEDLLKNVADSTGGAFYRADDREQLAQIYAQLDQLETQELETLTDRPKTDLFQWPLAASFLLALLFHGMQTIHFAWSRKRPAAVPHSLAVIVIIAAVLGSGATIETQLGQFHFLRPAWWLALLPACLVLEGIRRRGDSTRQWQGVIADHLLKHLLVNPNQRRRFLPIHLLAIAWFSSVVALAGPTWKREPAPFTDDEAALVIALEVSPTMMAQDVQPSRLERSVQKIRDLMAARPGTNTALVAYAGSAHLVMPMTTDGEIVATFAGELLPDVMPIQEGDAVAEAVALANQQLAQAQKSGSILVITDGIDASQNALLAKERRAPVQVLAVASDLNKPLPLDSPPAPAIDADALTTSAKAAGASWTQVTADSTDVNRLLRNIQRSFVASAQADGSERWQDMGYWLTPWITLMTLAWFRPGWVVKGGTR